MDSLLNDILSVSEYTDMLLNDIDTVEFTCGIDARQIVITTPMQDSRRDKYLRVETIDEQSPSIKSTEYVLCQELKDCATWHWFVGKQKQEQLIDKFWNALRVALE